MNRLLKVQGLIFVILAWSVLSCIAASAADHVAIPVRNPLKPVTVKVALHAGSIWVTGYPGKEVILDAQANGEGNRNRSTRKALVQPKDLMRISSPLTGLTVQQENNVVNIGSNAGYRSITVALKVPFKTDLVLNTNGSGTISVNQVEGDVLIDDAASQQTSKGPYRSGSHGRGNIEINEVKGEIEINNARGSVVLNQISGNAVAYAPNGSIRASFLHVRPGKPMSFSSMNGMIDVWLPPGIKANISMQSSKGEIHSDFDIKIDSATTEPVAAGAKYRSAGRSNSMSRTLNGKINGGGPEIQLKTYKGNIYIRKFLEVPPGSRQQQSGIRPDLKPKPKK